MRSGCDIVRPQSIQDDQQMAIRRLKLSVRGRDRQAEGDGKSQAADHQKSSIVSLRVGVFPCRIELPLHQSGVRLFTLPCERSLQSEQRPRVPRMLDEIVAEGAFGIRSASRRELRRAERFAHRIEPHRRLVVGKLIGGCDGLLPERDRAIMVGTCRRHSRFER